MICWCGNNGEMREIVHRVYKSEVRGIRQRGSGRKLAGENQWVTKAIRLLLYAF